MCGQLIPDEQSIKQRREKTNREETKNIIYIYIYIQKKERKG